MDYRKFAEDELKHIEELRAAEKICGDRLSDLNEQLHTSRVPSLQSDPVKGGGSKIEDRWLNIISQKIDEEKRLRNVRRRLKRFNTAWAVLSDRDQNVLTVFYIRSCRGAAERIASKEHCDERTAFRWRDDALLCFTRAFYGEVVT